MPLRGIAIFTTASADAVVSVAKRGAGPKDRLVQNDGYLYEKKIFCGGTIRSRAFSEKAAGVHIFVAAKGRESRKVPPQNVGRNRYFFGKMSPERYVNNTNNRRFFCAIF